MYRSFRTRTARVAVTVTSKTTPASTAEKDRDFVPGRDRLDGLRCAGPGLVRTLIDAALVYFAGAVAGAPFCLTKKTRNFAGFVVLAFLETE